MYLHDKKPRISWTTNRISDILWIDKVLQHTTSTKFIHTSHISNARYIWWQDMPYCLPLPLQPMMRWSLHPDIHPDFLQHSQCMEHYCSLEFHSVPHRCRPVCDVHVPSFQSQLNTETVGKIKRTIAGLMTFRHSYATKWYIPLVSSKNLVQVYHGQNTRFWN